jgi:single-strand DNA-binding protein
LINQVTLVGRLTKDPELRKTAEGASVAHITLAVNRNFRNHNGEIDTDFVQCTLWRKAAENTHHYCRKGAVIGITGRLQTRNYDGRDGKKVYVTEVVAESVRFLSGRVPESAHAAEPQTAAQAAAAQAAAIADQAAAMQSRGATVPVQGGQVAPEYGAQEQGNQAAVSQFGAQSQSGQATQSQFGSQVQAGQGTQSQFGAQSQAGQATQSQFGSHAQGGQGSQFGAQTQANQSVSVNSGGQAAPQMGNTGAMPAQSAPPAPSEKKGEIEYAF